MVMASEMPMSALTLGKQVFLASAMVAIGLPSMGQALRVRPEIEATISAGTGSSAAGNASESDVALVLTPRAVFSSRGGRAAIEGTVGLRATAFANGTQDARISPEGRLRFRGELVD